ncbi:MAG TPA: hypothetical protein VF691_07795, partial [Cytophagaceae bacterium]
FSEQTVGIGLAHSLDKVLLGVKVNYYQLHIDEAPMRRNLIANFGGIVKFFETFIFAAQISNFNISKLSQERYLIPVYLRTGISYRPNKSLMVNIEAEKNIQYKGIVKLGIEYTIVNRLMIRTGTTSQSFSPHFGAGFKSESFQLDYALISSSTLGFVHQISCSYKIKSK